MIMKVMSKRDTFLCGRRYLWALLHHESALSAGPEGEGLIMPFAGQISMRLHVTDFEASHATRLRPSMQHVGRL
jgi:hypothetical protein